MEVLDIRQLIGETTEYDKKLALEVKKPKSWCKSVSAFANGIGGKLVWGIADDDTLIGLVNAELSILEIKVLWCESQQFAKTDTAPVQHLERIVGNRLVHHNFGEFQILVLRPEVHFLCVLHTDAPCLAAGLVLRS